MSRLMPLTELESARRVLQEMRDTITRQSGQNALWAFEDVIRELTRHDGSFRPRIPETPLFNAPAPTMDEIDDIRIRLSSLEERSAREDEANEALSRSMERPDE